MRLKSIDSKQFDLIATDDCRPLSFPFDERPPFLRSLSRTDVCTITASGICTSSSGVSSLVVGGYDVWRYGLGDPVRHNKDHYGIVRVQGRYMIRGPTKDDEQWIDELPERIVGIPIVSRNR